MLDVFFAIKLLSDICSKLSLLHNLEQLPLWYLSILFMQEVILSYADHKVIVFAAVN